MADPVSLAITIALDAATMALTAMRKIEGPRLSDLKVSTADYGTPLVQFYGTKRLELPCVYAEDIREEKHQNKTKGGKYNEYKYFGTWASFIADHEIDAVLKLWLDKHLVLDRTGTSGPVMPLLNGPFGISVKIGASNQLRIYLGTETQSPDPRLVATIEGREGAGTCPAYLGEAYMVFEDIPLEKFGNRLPQTSCQASRNLLPAHPYEVVQTEAGSNRSFLFSPTGKYLAYWIDSGGGSVEWWDVASKFLLGSSPSAGAMNALSSTPSITADGVLYFVGDVQSGVDVIVTQFEVPVLGTPVGTEVSGSHRLFDQTRALDADTGRTIITAFDNTAGYIRDAVAISHTQSLREAFVTDGGTLLGVFHPTGSSNQFTIENLDTGESHAIVGLVTRSGPGTARACHVPSAEHFFVHSDGKFYLIDDQTFAIKASGTALWGTPNLPAQQPGSTSFWDVSASPYEEFSLLDGSLLNSYNKTDWLLTVANASGYDALNHAVWERAAGATNQDITIRYLDRATGGGWTLGAICADVALQTGMPESAFDFSDLDQSVLGYSWTQGPAKQVIGPLLDLFDSDIRPHGFIQQGLKRGQALSGDTVPTDMMVPDGDQPLYRIPQTPETELPVRVWATFADPDAEEQPNDAMAQRNAAAVKTSMEANFDLTTLAINKDDIQPLVERALRRYWIGAAKPEFSASPRELKTEPGDVRMISADGELIRSRCTRTKIRANRMIDFEWEQDGEVQFDPPAWQLDDAASISSLHVSPGGSSLGRTNDTVQFPVGSKGFQIDTPLLADADDQTAPFLYDAAAPEQSGFWPGASVWQSDTNEADAVFAAGWDDFASDQAATWGRCLTTLPDALVEVMDEHNSVTILLPAGGTLSSVTDDALLASQRVNLALIGNELVQFRDAQLTGTNKYEISGFIRGVRGTEWATADHTAGETFLLINSQLRKRTIGASEIGDTDYYKTVTIGDDQDAATTVAVDFSAAAHRPYAPCRVTMTRDTGTGDWTISWTRRTRIGGATLDGQDVPLGETSELYRVKIMNGATVLNSYDVTAATKVYTNAEQTADWGSAQTSLTVEICQVSPALSLEGFATTASA